VHEAGVEDDRRCEGVVNEELAKPESCVENIEDQVRRSPRANQGKADVRPKASVPVRSMK
jgi:hypothetical protein